MKRAMATGGALLCGVAMTLAQQSRLSDEAGRVIALETAWNHAIEAKDTKAMDMLMVDGMVALDSDGVLMPKKEYLGSFKAPDFEPVQAVTEESNVQMYGDTAIVTGIFRLKSMEKGKPSVLRQRTVDTWVKIGGTWKCAAAVAVTIPGKKPAD